MSNYMLYVDEKPTRVVNSLEEARQLAAPHVAKKIPLKIESYVAPAPSQIWIYDYSLDDWVKQA